MKKRKVYRTYGVVFEVKRGRRYEYLNEQGKLVATASPRTRWKVLLDLGEIREQEIAPGRGQRRWRARRHAAGPRRMSFRQYMKELGSQDEILGRIPSAALELFPFNAGAAQAAAEAAGFFAVIDSSITHEVYFRGHPIGYVSAEQELPEYWLVGNAEEGYSLLWYDGDPYMGPEIGVVGSFQWETAAAARTFLAAA